MKKLFTPELRIGIDLGGTKIEGIALDSSGKTLFTKRIATPAQDYSKILTSVAELILEIEQKLSQQGSLGIGMPGTISHLSGRVKNSNTTCLNGTFFKQDLESYLKRSIRIENDANCFALSEATDGAAAGASVVYGVILGTGVGGGLVVNGQIISGANSIAGEWGHNPLPWPEEDELPGSTCYCKKSGCLETWISGPGLVADFKRLTGKDRQPPAIIENAEKGDEKARDVLINYKTRLARGLASMINILDPGVIVLGGGMSNYSELYQDIPEIWHEFIFSDQIATKLLPAKFGDSSGVRGAAWLWNEI